MQRTMTNTASPSRRRGKPFEKGNAGRPIGSRNKRTLALEAMLDDQAEAVTEMVLERARGGDWNAQRLCFEQIHPVRRDRAISLDMPAIKGASDGALALSAIVAAIAAGGITPNEGSVLASIIEKVTRAFDVQDSAKKLEALETQVEADNEQKSKK